jgi:hypothetical protein
LKKWTIFLIKNDSNKMGGGIFEEVDNIFFLLKMICLPIKYEWGGGNISALNQ